MGSVVPVIVVLERRVEPAHPFGGAPVLLAPSALRCLNLDPWISAWVASTDELLGPCIALRLLWR